MVLKIRPGFVVLSARLRIRELSLGRLIRMKTYPWAPWMVSVVGGGSRGPRSAFGSTIWNLRHRLRPECGACIF